MPAHAFHLAQGCEGKNVIIIGAGTIGLLALQCARELGAKSITAIDINPQKLALAKMLGATHVFNSKEMSGKQIQTALEEIQFDQLVLETAGTPQTVALGIEVAGPRAQLALVGTLHHDLTLPFATFGQILRKELTIVGSWMNYSGPWPGKEWQTAVPKALPAKSRRSTVRRCRGKSCLNSPDQLSQQSELAHITFRKLSFNFHYPSITLRSVNYQAN